MRSKLFNEFANLNKSFQEDFRLLWSLPAPVQKALVPLVDRLSKAETTGESKQILDQACQDLHFEAQKLLRTVKVLKFMREVWNPATDTAQGFLKDLEELDLLPPKKSRKGADFLLDFLSSLEKDNARTLEKAYANSCLPSYRGSTTLVDFRAVFRTPFGVGTNTHIEKYKADCAGFVPVVLVQIEMDSGDPDKLQFQLEEGSLRRCIESLQAALKDLEAAKSVFPGRK